MAARKASCFVQVARLAVPDAAYCYSVAPSVDLPVVWPHEVLCQTGQANFEPIWGKSGLFKPKELCIRWDAQWYHLVNTIKRFVRSGDAAWCQLALATSFSSYDDTDYAPPLLQ